MARRSAATFADPSAAEVHAEASEMHDAGLNACFREHRGDRPREALGPFDHSDQDVLHPRLRSSFITLSQNFAPPRCSIQSPSTSRLPADPFGLRCASIAGAHGGTAVRGRSRGAGDKAPSLQPESSYFVTWYDFMTLVIRHNKTAKVHSSSSTIPSTPFKMIQISTTLFDPEYRAGTDARKLLEVAHWICPCR